MKISILALAVLGSLANVAYAQSSVTMYGSIDGGLRSVDHVNGAGDSRTSVSTIGTYNTNRLGFRGVEDLGDGLKAHFTLESGFVTSTGTLDSTRLFNRTASVGLSGTWGAVDVGRQYTLAFLTVFAYDPYRFKYVVIAPTTRASVSAGTRHDSSIRYRKAFGDLTVSAAHAAGEQAGSSGDGSSNSLALSYAPGPFNVGIAYTERKVSPMSIGVLGGNIGRATGNLITAGIEANTFRDNKHLTFGGAYTSGPLRLSAGYADEKQKTGTVSGDNVITTAWGGINYAVTPLIELTAAYYQTDLELVGAKGKQKLILLGATYALSKRTSLYAGLDTTKLSGTQILGFGQALTEDRSSGVSVGLNHFF